MTITTADYIEWLKKRDFAIIKQADEIHELRAQTARDAATISDLAERLADYAPANPYEGE